MCTKQRMKITVAMHRCKAMIGLLFLLLSCNRTLSSKENQGPLAEKSGSSSPKNIKKSKAQKVHPLYPTADAAGTRRLYLLDDPPAPLKPPTTRVPKVPTLKWTRHAHCEVDEMDFLCSVPTKRNLRYHWRVGRKKELIIWAEKVMAKRTAASIWFKRDKEGHLNQILFFDAYGSLERIQYFAPKTNRYSARKLNGANALAGCGYMEVRKTKDELRSEVACLQWNHKPMKDLSGVAITRLRRDGATSMVVEKSFFDTVGQPISNTDGVHRIVFRRDKYGRIRKESYFNLASKPVRSLKNGCFGLQRNYDAEGLLSEKRCLDTSGHLEANAEVTITVYKRNFFGCPISESYFNQKGKPKANAEGIQSVEWSVNYRCLHLSKTCYYKSGRVRCGSKEPAVYRYKLDKKGRVESVKHFSPDKKPDRDPQFGVFEVRTQYDDLSNPIQTSCFDKKAKPINCGVSSGFHMMRSKFDHLGRNIEDRFYDIKGQPTSNLNTFIRRYRYDLYDHLYESDDYDAENHLVESLGSASRRYLYNERHELFAVLLLDKNLKPAQYEGCFTGHQCPHQKWHAVRVMRGPTGRAEKNLFFDYHRQLIHTIDCHKSACWE